MVAGRRQELAYPLRWYSIPNLWRYDRPQRGRLREHWQLNADIFGLDTVSAETEIIKLADAIMKRFGAKRTMYEIRINSRHFVDHLLKTYLGLSEVEAHTIAKLIDKMHKMSQAEFIALVDAAMSPSHRDADTTQKLLAVLATQNPDELPAELAAHSSVYSLMNTRTFAIEPLPIVSGSIACIFPSTISTGSLGLRCARGVSFERPRLNAFLPRFRRQVFCPFSSIIA
jgi:histidyl-tRNA synthetase